MCRTAGAAVLATLFAMGTEWAVPDSDRLGRAKDYIADEQWTRAVTELRAAVADPKEKNKDEALYWLAHSLNQSGDSAAAIATIRKLEQQYPSSLWVKPAGSLRLDIAVHLRRNDVLWWTAAPPPPPPAPPAPATAPGVAAPPAPPPPPTPRALPRPRGEAGGAPAMPAPAVAPTPLPPTVDPTPPALPIPPTPPTAWLPEFYRPDMDLRIQALGRLMPTDASRVIPILKEIALDGTDPREASRAIFVLAQSGKPEARDTVFQVARSGPETVRIAAVRELGRFGGPGVAEQLMQVYSSGDSPVKLQVVSSLGLRLERSALLHIAEAETDPHLKTTAIVMLGQAGGVEQLSVLYLHASPEARRSIILGLFNARAEDALIRIADEEKDPLLRGEVLTRLQLLGTAKARDYLLKEGRIR
jgi:hypothetical protein